MTKSKAIEILNIGYDGCVKVRETLHDIPDDVGYLNDLLIALLTAIDVLKQSSTVEAGHDNGWISVKDRLPDEDTWVLVYARQGSYTNLKVDYIHGGVWFNSILVTHWMPLPQEPESEDNAK